MHACMSVYTDPHSTTHHSFIPYHHTYHISLYIQISEDEDPAGHVTDPISEDVDPAHHVPDSGPPPQITDQISAVSHISLVSVLGCSAILQSSTRL